MQFTHAWSPCGGKACLKPCSSSIPVNFISASLNKVVEKGKGGERLHNKARRGEKMKVSARNVTVYNFDVERSLNDGVSCSKGTYIRSLCADLGKALSSCAHIVSLRRDSIGDERTGGSYYKRVHVSIFNYLYNYQFASIFVLFSEYNFLFLSIDYKI